MNIMKTLSNAHINGPLKAVGLPFLPFCLALLFSLCAATQAIADEQENLAGLIQVALEQNSEILAARSRAAESNEKIRQAGSLPDPRLGFEYYLQSIETRTGPQEAIISLNQSIPWPGRLSLDKKIKQNEADIAVAVMVDTSFSVVRRVKEAYVEFGYLQQAHKITGHILELMNYLEGIAHTNYSSGKASYTDVLKIQIEIDKLENRQRSLEDSTAPIRVQLNSLLGTDRNMARRQPDALLTVTLDKQEDEIYSLAEANSPKILAGRHKVARNQHSLGVADQGFYPDFNLSIRTILTGEAEFGTPPDSGRDPVIAGLTVNLPVFFERRNGEIAEKQASVRTARNELEQARYSLEMQIESTLFRYRDAQRLLELYSESLIPKVRQELDVALEAFQGGQYSILELIDAEKNWLNFELARIRAQADMTIQVARLEELAGTTLADWDSET